MNSKLKSRKLPQPKTSPNHLMLTQNNRYRFKKYALKYHPLKSPAQMRMFLPKFHAICEAYEVLSNQ